MTLDLARWQFAITTVYHFLFVPLTIGLSLLVAGMQTAWYRTDDERYLRMTKFWGKLLLINFAMGVVTGIVQEFQFGMSWSDYSRYVGDVFGAPLAIEGLLAFFLESTFLGLWIFGWDRLPKRLHLACIWLASIGTVLSAYFILAANSWMQHPVGSVVNDERGRAELVDFGAVLTNSTAVGAFLHTITACFVTGGMFVVAISAWHLARGRHTEVFRPSMRLGLVTVLIASLGVVVTGDLQARLMTEQQPMKMAAAEALYDTVAPASFSLFTIGTPDGSQELFSVRVPRILSFMATGSFDGEVEGINQLQAAAEQTYGPGDYTPDIPVTYWTFRLMIGFGMLAGLLSVVGLWLTRRSARRPVPRWFYVAGVAGLVLPFAANSVGWIFTEMGRQPWAVYGMLRTADGVSPSVSTPMALTSLIVLTLLYGALAVVDGYLMVRYAEAGPPPVAPESPADTDEPRPLAVAY
ncbi:cytochrome ubiquinol oxidase subunit I [Pseudonocardia sp. KRD-184]|uniref:Cytochrome ubiquinol oxidase subunit I n=1 Tax=Pseudonocardia oceani TaxID=2792013 RepID=A0ABS6UHD7_9PSEU|nr:cytochrome ubiquinol oxidase subunit I [Pseudonocardia oceani]MBW0089905.1 cytochrome ubiquinol oxidase subunit I [Pseudonocardia oceani]MBW0096964.1 cytochrome ubiquinol oxidase subunit I [Pseudonocardia oceani]MBW0109639.1 cytochrome ubiquinol oxidase subunit I [Pseudonocardia oceani]MBW0122505.1 cytochrome ubiquinol oxidase subunit I [Pseudonocardia oceani]MBW0131675.1 cytochrome ubiquinol oxidase subunit I [Pseudonocardia oceani]